jgi:hypothetical protein
VSEVGGCSSLDGSTDLGPTDRLTVLIFFVSIIFNNSLPLPPPTRLLIAECVIITRITHGISELCPTEEMAVTGPMATPSRQDGHSEAL